MTNEVERIVRREPPYVAVVGAGVDVRISVEDDDDVEIVRLAIQMAERRRPSPTNDQRERVNSED